MRTVIGIILFTVFSSAQAIEFTTEKSNKQELETVALLQALRQSHDTAKWEFTDKVHIDAKAIPHSYPILTLHTRHTTREQKDLLLSTYLHEQIHWYMDINQQKTAAAITELKELFKDVPVGFPEGARNAHSTYLHLLVCYLELEAISELISEQRVRAVIRFWQQDHYTWIYRQVEANKSKIAKVIKNHDLTMQ